MSHFHLNHQSLLQGKFELKKLNLAFVFQVNCPGCFAHAIPLVNALHDKYNNKMGFIGISTAFEDFDFNTEVNTHNLLENGTVEGETKKYLKSEGHDTYPLKLEFPVAFDHIHEAPHELSNDQIELICNTNPNFKSWPPFEKEDMINRVKDHYKSFQIIAETFTFNQLRGTPSFILFDDTNFILKSHFGHQDPTTLMQEIESFLSL